METCVGVGEYEIDADKLIALVEARPEIYDITLKGHHNQDIINKHWQDIASEMNVSAFGCKAKWHNLRSSYARYLRKIKKQPSGSAGKKKKWYLADAMSFVEDYVGPCRKMTNNLSSGRNEQTPVTYVQTASNDGNSEEGQQEDEETSLVCDDGAEHLHIQMRPSVIEQSVEINPKEKTSAADIIAGPMAEYFKFITERKRNQYDDPVTMFFKSLVPDVKKLSSKRQRNFKAKVLCILNEFLDEQENDTTPCSSRPASTPSTNSDSFAHHLSSNSVNSYHVSHPRPHFDGLQQQTFDNSTQGPF